MSRKENYIKEKMKRNRRKKWIAFSSLLFLLLVTCGGAYLAARLNRAEKAIHQEVETVNLRQEEIKDTDSFSVLLLGIDNGAYGRGTEVGRSDTMLLVTVNEKQGKTTIVSIPRDSYTEIIGYGTNDKINHAYAFGKETMSINSVQNMLNVPIDYYVTVDMSGLMGLVDAVGGLEITPALTFTYEDESFTEGETRHVDGEAALRYARMRYDDPEGDMGRQKRQQYVIQKLVEKLLDLGSVTKYEEILKTLENSVRTNFTIDKLLSIQQNYKTALSNFQSDTITGEGAMIDGIYYFIIPEEEKLRISNVLRESLDLDPIDSLKHIETNELQTVPDIQTHEPINQELYQDEVQDDYVEPIFINPEIQYQDTEEVTPAPAQPQTTARQTAAPQTQASQQSTDQTQPQTQPTTPVAPTTEAPAPATTTAPAADTIAPKPESTPNSNSGDNGNN